MEFKCKSCQQLLRINETKYDSESVIVTCPNCSSKNTVILPEKAKMVSAQNIKGPSKINTNLGRANFSLHISLSLPGLLLFILSIMLIAMNQAMVGGIIIMLGIGLIIAGFVLGYVYLYRAWNYIQDSNSRATPGQAVGFLFIPFYNFYWIFQAFHGWAIDFNNYVDKNSLDIKKVNPVLYLTFAVLSIVSIVPFIGYIASIANIIIWYMIIFQMTERINAMADLPPQTNSLVNTENKDNLKNNNDIIKTDDEDDWGDAESDD